MSELFDPLPGNGSVISSLGILAFLEDFNLMITSNIVFVFRITDSTDFFDDLMKSEGILLILLIDINNLYVTGKYPKYESGYSNTPFNAHDAFVKTAKGDH